MNCQFVLTLGVLTICDRWQLEVTTCDTWQCDTVVWLSIAHPHAQAKLTWLHLIPKITKNMPTSSIPRTPNSAVAWQLQKIDEIYKKSIKCPPKIPATIAFIFVLKMSERQTNAGNLDLNLSLSLPHSLTLSTFVMSMLNSLSLILGTLMRWMIDPWHLKRYTRVYSPLPKWNPLSSSNMEE